MEVLGEAMARSESNRRWSLKASQLAEFRDTHPYEDAVGVITQCRLEVAKMGYIGSSQRGTGGTSETQAITRFDATSHEMHKITLHL